MGILQLFVSRTLQVTLLMSILYFKDVCAVDQCYSCDLKPSNQECQQTEVIEDCPNNGMDYVCQTVVMADLFEGLQVKKECNTKEACLNQTQYFEGFCNRDIPHLTGSICHYCCDNEELCNTDYPKHDTVQVKITGTDSEAQNLTVCEDEGSSVYLECPINSWLYINQAYYGKKVQQDQGCSYEATDYTLDALTYLYKCVGKNTCTFDLSWGEYAALIPQDTVYSGQSYFYISVNCLDDVISVSPTPTNVVKASSISNLYPLLNYNLLYTCDDTAYAGVEMDCPNQSVLNVYQYKYGKIQSSSDDRCYYTHKDTKADAELDFTTSVKTLCNGKHSCVNLFEWSKFDILFSSDVYRGNLYIDVLYACVEVTTESPESSTLVKASTIASFYPFLNSYQFYLCDDTPYTGVELDCSGLNVLNVYQYLYGKIQSSSESRCHNIHKDSRPDRVLDFTSSAQSFCNGKQSCENLFEWSQYDTLFSSDIYNGNLYIDIVYSCTEATMSTPVPAVETTEAPTQEAQTTEAPTQKAQTTEAPTQEVQTTTADILVTTTGLLDAETTTDVDQMTTEEQLWSSTSEPGSTTEALVTTEMTQTTVPSTSHAIMETTSLTVETTATTEADIVTTPTVSAEPLTSEKTMVTGSTTSTNENTSEDLTPEDSSQAVTTGPHVRDTTTEKMNVQTEATTKTYTTTETAETEHNTEASTISMGNESTTELTEQDPCTGTCNGHSLPQSSDREFVKRLATGITCAVVIIIGIFAALIYIYKKRKNERRHEKNTLVQETKQSRISHTFGGPYSRATLPYLPQTDTAYGHLETISMYSTKTASTSAYDLTEASNHNTVVNIPTNQSLTIKLDDDNSHGLNIKSTTSTSVNGLNYQSGKVTIALDGEYAFIVPSSDRGNAQS